MRRLKWLWLRLFYPTDFGRAAFIRVTNSNVLYTKQVLEVRKGKNNTFLLILLNLSPYKSPFNQYYPKSVPNPDILIISLPKNDKMLGLAKTSFLTILPIFAMEISYIKMHWWAKLSTSDIFQIRFPSHVLVFNLLFCMR